MDEQDEASDDINDGSHDPQIAAVLSYLTGERAGIHAMPPVTEQPFVRLVRWRLMKAWDPGSTRYPSPHRILIGHDGIEGRVSSMVQHLDLDEMRATTASGRVYQLVGPPDWDGDADWVFGRRAGHLKTADSTRALMQLQEKRYRREL